MSDFYDHKDDWYRIELNLNEHKDDTIKHITDDERSAWNELIGHDHGDVNMYPRWDRAVEFTPTNSSIHKISGGAFHIFVTVKKVAGVESGDGDYALVGALNQEAIDAPDYDITATAGAESDSIVVIAGYTSDSHNNITQMSNVLKPSKNPLYIRFAAGTYNGVSTFDADNIRCFIVPATSAEVVIERIEATNTYRFSVVSTGDPALILA